MGNYLEKLRANRIRFPESHAGFLHNLFYLADSLKEEEEIRLNIEGGFEKYRECVKEERMEGILLSVRWERVNGYRCVACRAVIRTKVLLAQLDKYIVK